MRQTIKWLSVALISWLLTACSGLTAVDDQGAPVGELKWPNVATDVTFDNRRGIYGEIDRIQLVKKGATRDDVYQLIGRPQFSEGFRVHEWDYVFYFRMDDGQELTCQYKVLFDKNYRASNFYWKAASPEDAHCPPNQEVVFSTDTLFRFDGSEIEDLLPGGQQQLDRLVATLQNQPLRAIQIYGFTDYLGQKSYNQKLSTRRAETIKHYFIQQGIDEKLITAEGRADDHALVYCGHLKDRARLIHCLQPNRRVEIVIER